MQAAHLPTNEAQRIAELLKLQILDTDVEQIFDDLTALAADICQMPIALVSLVDSQRQWFKSHHGIEVRETPREFAFCAHTILQDEPLIVHDAHQDERFRDNPLVIGEPKVRFYAGYPLKMDSGHNLGTLSVIDYEPRELNQNQKKVLKTLTEQVISQLELRKKIHELSSRNFELEQLSYVLSHDLKAPTRGIQSLAHAILEDLEVESNIDVRNELRLIANRSRHMGNLIESILAYYTIGEHEIEFELVKTGDLIKEILHSYTPDKDVRFEYKKAMPTVYGQRIYLLQVFSNLLTNAIKYCDKDVCVITFDHQCLSNVIQFSVADNGIGIQDENLDKVFNLFYIGNTISRVDSAGVGLAIVRKIIEDQGGQVSVTSQVGEGTTFHFTWPNPQKYESNI